ncbi:MAG: right-handed parallel beta-helix repeat-containing protein [Thermoproteota archaeon]|nr:right-handed parallel beta-helix repeat-containing protein [Thermoproteota archaeon]
MITLLFALIIAPIIFLAGYTHGNNDKASPNPIVYPAVQMETADYVIYKNGSTVYAKNSSTGAIDYSGTNASEAIQHALNAKGTIHIQKGTYFLDTELLISSDTWLQLSPQTTLRAAKGKYAIENQDSVNGDSNIKITGGTITGEGVSAALINIAKSSYIQIAYGEYCYSNKSGINLWNCNHVSIQTNRIHHNNDDGITLNGDCTYKNHRISGNYIYNNGNDTYQNRVGSGIHAINYATNLIITDNYVYNNQLSGIYIEASEKTVWGDCHDIIVSDNIVYDNREGDGILIMYSYNFIISDNWSHHNHGDGIVVDGVNSGTINGNICTDNLGRGILVTSEATQKHLPIQVGNVTITNNVANKNGGCPTANYEGICLWNASYCVITGNIVQDNSGFGINEYAPAGGTTDYNIIVSNQASGNHHITTDIEYVGANTLVIANVGRYIPQGNYTTTPP